jgi:glycosyltransferase involved in cell wall biosynthesis
MTEARAALIRHETSGDHPSSVEIELSVVVPILDERDSLAELHAGLTAVLADVGKSYEILFVDDGSTDGSLEIGRALAAADPHVSLIELRRNFGKAAALQAGFKLARGAVVITMDGDLQDQPEEIPAFLAVLDEDDDVDLVCGWKRDRQDPAHKTVPSRIFNLVTSGLTGVKLRDFNCGFKAYRREPVDSLDIYGDLHRFIPVLAHAKGYRIREIPVRHNPRRHGKSKYGRQRYLRGALDLLTVLFLCGFAFRPLHLFGAIGVGLLLVGLAIDGWLAIEWVLGLGYLSNRPLLLFGSVLIMCGLQILIFGLLAEMVTARSYRQQDIRDLVRRVHQDGGGGAEFARQPVRLAARG